METTIDKEAIEKVDKEISQQEEAKLEEKIEKVKAEQDEKFADAVKAMATEIKNAVAPEPEAPKEEVKADVDVEKIVADKVAEQTKQMREEFDKQMDQIKLRKSVSSEDTEKAEPKKEKTAAEMTEREKDEKDREFFRTMGVPGL
jgi:hypothetical protein